MRGRRPFLALLGSAAAIVPLAGASGQVTTIPSLTASVGGAYSTNPFLTVDGEDSASVQLNVQPSLQLIDGADTALITANYNRADYLTRYGSNSGYGGSVSGTTRPNARTTLGISASYDSQVLGAQNGFATPLNPILTSPVTGGSTTGTGVDVGTAPVVSTPIVTNPVLTTPGLPIVNGDVGLIGLRQRRNTLSAGLTGSYAPGPLSTWNAGVNVQRATYPGRNGNGEGLSLFASNFRSYGGNLGYNRSLTELSSVGFQLSGTYVDYDSGTQTQIYTPRVTYSRTLSELTTLNVAVGAGITHDEGGTFVSVAFDGTLCRNGERLRGCAIVSRVPSATGLGGVRVQTTLGANATYTISPNTSASASGNYVRVGAIQSDQAQVPVLGLGAQDYFTGDVSLQRRLGRMFSAVASVSYRTASGIGADIPGDITGRLGISVFLGQSR
ncbi:hypothetical protein Q5H91_07965 [Sphingomonas sp. KR1UV-12]|uniref:Beta-barrel porin 2 n=1 Tax=Sphingomonas aurea TaxID=3063994 RepID=A0ABT9EKJ8_9SPHN|nr:hypothetical protein [Sphingomonas sp. KR1UV-12]MDP1027143.1 hypothetical protein [Sphingomonas sp. KR1UV-12]